MTPKEIHKRVSLINKTMKKYQDELVKLQDLCAHESATIKYRGSTGNYDPSDNCYWTEHKCPTCGKFWCVYKD